MSKSIMPSASEKAKLEVADVAAVCRVMPMPASSYSVKACMANVKAELGWSEARSLAVRVELGLMAMVMK